MRLFLLLLSFFAGILFPKVGLCQGNLILKTFLNGKVQLLVPKTCDSLTDAEIEKRFPDSELRPSVILTDTGEFHGLKIVMMPQDVKENEVGQFKYFHVKRMKLEPNQEWLGDGMKNINGKNVGYVKVIHTDKNTFAYYFFTSLEGKLLLITYNCPDVAWPAMQEIVERIVNSLHLK